MIKKWKLLFSLLALPVLVSLFSSSSASAADYYAAANRFLYNGTNNYGSTPQWSAPVRYNEYVPIAFLYGLQINTYPSGAPTGQYVTVRGKVNVSARNQGQNLFPSFNPNALNNLQVQCSWGNQYLTTVGSSVLNSIGSGYFSPNSVIWNDITFTWNGYFPNGYQNVHSGDLLSCSVRPVINNTVYAVPMITGSNSPQTYVYGDNSSYDSYLSVETSQDQDLTALNEINNSIQNQTNIIINGTDAILGGIDDVISSQNATTNAVNNLNLTIEEAENGEQERWEVDKQEEAEREQQGKDDSDEVLSIFNFNFSNPFSPILDMFSSNQCVNIPTIAQWIHSSTSQYCSWWSQSVRQVATPIFGLGSSMLLFGFIVRWLKQKNGVEVE